MPGPVGRSRRHVENEQGSDCPDRFALGRYRLMEGAVLLPEAADEFDAGTPDFARQNSVSEAA